MTAWMRTHPMRSIVPEEKLGSRKSSIAHWGRFTVMAPAFQKNGQSIQLLKWIKMLGHCQYIIIIIACFTLFFMSRSCEFGVTEPTTSTMSPTNASLTPMPLCPPTSHYLCSKNKVCILKTSLCNQVNDCGDWEDEGNCHTDECVTSNGNCSQLCMDTPNGHHCSCRQGYIMLNGTCAGETKDPTITNTVDV